MKIRLISIALIFSLLFAFASCRPIGKNGETQNGETENSASETASVTETEPAVTTEEPSETVTEKETTTVKALSETTVTETTAEKTTAAKTTTTKPATTKATTKATTLVTELITTTKAVTTTLRDTTGTSKSAAFDKSKATSTESRVYFSDLKYGVDLYRRVTIYYGTDANGKKYKLGEEETSRTYDRSTYLASYSELLPAAKKNRQTYASYINEVLRLTNAMRAEGGLSPLRLDEKLTEQANVRAEEIAWSGKHSHRRPNTKSYTSLFLDNGFTTGTSGENIGWYYKTPADVCAAWKASESHYANIMNPAFKTIGIGVAQEADPSLNLCWVQHFYGE